MKHTRKPEVIEAFTYEQFIDYGKKHAENIHDGIPQSFYFKKITVVHEFDSSFILTNERSMLSFGPGQILVINSDDSFESYNEKEFKELFSPCQK